MRQSDFTITLPHCFISLYYQFFQQDSQDLCCSSLLILLIDGEESHVHLVHIWSRATGRIKGYLLSAVGSNHGLLVNHVFFDTPYPPQSEYSIT